MARGSRYLNEEKIITTDVRGRAALICTTIVAGLITVTACSPVAVPREATHSEALPTGSEQTVLDPGAFTSTIDHPFWPMEPGTRWTFRETAPEGDDLRVIVTVTDATKLIANGVEARVVRDTVYRGTDVIEDTFDWYAQDDSGAIWYLGEQTAEFENGQIVSTHGSFEAGVNGAEAGIVMPANPTPGQKYRQEYFAGEAEDNGEIFSVTEMADAPFGHFDDVLMTRDTITIEPDVLQYKFYAKNVGPVLVLDVSGGGGGREELVSIDTAPAGAGLGPLGQPD